MPAAVIGGVIAGVGAIGASAISSSAQKKAAKTAAEAQQVAVDHSLEIAKGQEKLFRDIYESNTNNFQPYLNSGYGAQAQAMQLLGIKPMTAEQFNTGQWHQAGKPIDYSNPAEIRTQAPAPAPQAATGVGGNANLAAQAEEAVRRGANPIQVAQRMGLYNTEQLL